MTNSSKVPTPPDEFFAEAVREAVGKPGWRPGDWLALLVATESAWPTVRGLVANRVSWKQIAGMGSRGAFLSRPLRALARRSLVRWLGMALAVPAAVLGVREMFRFRRRLPEMKQRVEETRTELQRLNQVLSEGHLEAKAYAERLAGLRASLLRVDEA